MKIKRSSFLFLLLLSYPIAAQQYKDFKQYYENGQLAIDGELVSKFKYITPEDDDDWLKTGTWTIYYEDGSKALQGAYLRGEKVEEWTAYYNNGEVYLQGKYEQYYVDASEMLFNTDDRFVRSVGTWISYWDDGQVASLYTFKDNGAINTRVVNTKYEDKYSYKSGAYGKGQMAISIQFSWNWQQQPFIEIENSILQMGSFYRYGDWTEYYETGELSAEGSYNWKTNKSDGDWKLYYKNGKLKTEKTFKDGKINGIVKHYREDGTVSSEGAYKDGKCNGFYKTWNKEGVLTQNSQCLGDGKVIRKYLHPSGTVRSKGKEIYTAAKEYVKDSLWTFYGENEKIELVEIHSMGKHLGYWNQFLDDGTQILKNGNGEYRLYTDGILTMSSEHSNGSRNGITTWYYTNGQIKQSALYKYDENSKPYGLRWEILSSFHKDGTPRNKGTLKDGSGTWVSYDDEGNITKLTKFENGIQVE